MLTRLEALLDGYKIVLDVSRMNTRVCTEFPFPFKKIMFGEKMKKRRKDKRKN